MKFRKPRAPVQPRRYIGYKPNRSKYVPAKGSHIPGGTRRWLRNLAEWVAYFETNVLTRAGARSVADENVR